MHSAQSLRSFVILVLALLTGLLYGTASRAGAADSPVVVGDLGEPSRFLFKGVASFSPNALQDGLLGSAEFLLAAHPRAPFDAFVTSLQRLILRGYRHTGFSDADIAVEYDKQVGAVEVTVHEGSRYMAGDVEIVGAKTVPVHAFIRRLTEPWPKPEAMTAKQWLHAEGHESAESVSTGSNDHGASDSAEVSTERLDATGKVVTPEDPIWQQGEPAAFDEPSLEKLAYKVSAALQDFGFFFAKIDVKVLPDPDTQTANLRIVILDEGPPGLIGDIVVTGNTRDSRDAILEYLQLKPGMAFDQDVITRAKLRLWRSARYLNDDIVPERPNTATSAAALSINVTEYAAAPALGGGFSEDEHALLRLCSWLSGIRSRGDDVIITMNDFSIASRIHLIFSDQGALATLGRDPNPDQENNLVAMLVPDHIGLLSTTLQTKALIALPRVQLEVHVSLVPEHDVKTGKEFALNFGAAFSTKVAAGQGAATSVVGGPVPLRFDLLAAPAACLSWAHLKDVQRSLLDGVLTFSSVSRGRLSIDARSNQLLEFVISWPNSSAEVNLRVEHGAFAAAKAEIETISATFPDRFDVTSPINAMAAFVIEDMLKGGPLAAAWFDGIGSKDRDRATDAADRVLKQQILRPLDELLTRWIAQRGPKRFFIPTDPSQGPAQAGTAIAGMLSAFIFRAVNDLFPRNSWPWTTAREAVFVASGIGKYTGLELKRIYESDQVGPIGYLTIADLLAYIKSPHSAALAQRGLGRLSTVDFRKDVALLLEGDSALARCVKRAARAVRDLPEPDVEALAVVLPLNARAFLFNASKLLRERPADPVESTLPAAFDTYWKTSLRAGVETKLLQLAVP
jgi:hypothetical protein